MGHKAIIKHVDQAPLTDAAKTARRDNDFPETRPGISPKQKTGAQLTQLVGCLLVFAAAVCFYLSTATVRWARNHVDIAPAFFVFTRFFLGFIIVCLSVSLKGKKIQPKRYSLLIGRAVANTIAVYCFYTAVANTSLAEANILNMTYPVFVALFSWIFLKEQRDKSMALGAIVAFIGIYLVLAKGPMSFSLLHLWGLTSGVCASFAIIFLNVSRRYHDTQTILFYLFGLGAVFTYMAFPETIYWPDPAQAYYLLLCSGLAIIGQYCITYGYRFVTAVEGSIISSTRIIIAATLGPLIAGDPAMNRHGWMGAALIFGVNVILAIKKTKNNSMR